MWGRWKARFIIFQCGQVLILSCGEGCRSFEPKGISHWIWLLWLPTRLWSLTKQTVARRWQISTASLEFYLHTSLLNHLANTIPESFMLGTKLCGPMILAANVFLSPEKRWLIDQGKGELQDQFLHPARLAQALVAMQAMSWCWPVGAPVKQERRSPLLAFFV